MPIWTFIVLGIVIFWTLDVFFEKRNSKSFNYSKYLHQLNSEETNRGVKGFTAIFAKTADKIAVPKDKEEALKQKLELANMTLTPKGFYAQKLVYPLVFVLLFLLIGLIQEQKVMLLLALLSGGLYFYPNFILRNRLKMAAEMRRFELPTYLTPLGLLLYSHTPYKAVKASVRYAGPYLRPFVETLAAEMDMYPGSTKPFKNFSRNVGIPEAESFISALQQAFNTDPVKSREIIQSQVIIMRKLREQNYLTLIEKQPLKMAKYNLVPIAGMVMIVGTIVITVISTRLG